MPSFLTHERLREELRAFAKGALRTELRELGDRVRREVSEELRELPLFHAESPVAVAPVTPVSIVRTQLDGGTRLMLHGGSSRSRQPTVELPVVSSRTSTIEHNLGRRHNSESDSREEDEGAGIMKSLRSFKVAENHKYLKQRSPSSNLEHKTSPSSKAPTPTSPVHMLRGLSKSFQRSSSGETKRQYLEPPGAEGTTVPGEVKDEGAREGETEDAGGAQGAPKPTTDLAFVQGTPLVGIGRFSSHAAVAPLDVCGTEPSSPSTSGSPALSTLKIVPKGPDSPAASGAFVGIMPAPKVSWGNTEAGPDYASEAQGESDGKGDAKPKDAPDINEVSNSFMSSAEDPFGSQMNQLYFQRDQRRKSTGMTEVSWKVSACSKTGEEAEWSRCYSFMLAMVENFHFNHFTALVIFANLITVGMQTNYLATEVTEQVPIAYSIAEAVFCAFFLVELLARLYVYRRAFFLMPGWHWNLFDCFMVALQMFEQFLELLIAVGTVGEGNHFSFGFLRALRILRVIRLLRAARILEHVRELQTIVLSIGSSIKSLCWTLLLLVLLIYIVGVCFTQLVLNYRLGHPETGTDSNFVTLYGSLGVSILTLYGSIMGGIDWLSAAEPLSRDIHPLMGLAFSLYVAFAVLAMMNVVTGVFVEASLKTARDHHEAILLSTASNLFADSDLDENGQVTWKEFQDRLDNPHMREFFKSIDVDISEAETVFHLLDFNESGSLDLDQFMGGCLRLRGPAKAVDLAMLMHETRRMARRQAKQMASLHRDVRSMLVIFRGVDCAKEDADPEGR